MLGKYSDISKLEYIRLTEADFNMIRDTATGQYVEVGTFHGASAYAASFNAELVDTIDIYVWRPQIGLDLLPRDNIARFLGTADDFIKEFQNPIDVLFIDGSHEYDYVKRDIAALCPLVKKNGIVMFHDYHPQSAGVKPAVDEWLAVTPHNILAHPVPNVCKILKVQIL